jgi:ATP-dependent RNA helicase DeaD
MSTFEALGLDPEILTAIEKLGFEHPTEIQIQAIPTILSSDQDLVALAQTGTGKTAAFGLPLIHRIRPELREPQAMVLSPTRELAMQIARDLESFARFLPNIRIEPVYGGTPIYNQIKAIRKGVHVVVGTPGRMLDLIKRGVLDLSTVQYVVLDEADEMLNMGFKKDLDSILGNTPEDKQTLLFSATMAEEVARIAQKYMADPYRITVGTKNAGAKKVEHHYYQVPARERYEALKRILAMEEDFYGIVFCRTRRDTEYVARKLNRDGFPADALNGDLSQAQRDKVMDRFRSGQITTLVATDVAARGLDVDDLSHVINYELPDDPEVYIHRSGRTGRAGKSGISAVIIHSRERHRIRNLERMSGKDFHQKRVPNGDEICQAQLRRRDAYFAGGKRTQRGFAELPSRNLSGTGRPQPGGVDPAFSDHGV